MAKRTRLVLADIASTPIIALALHKAAKGKRHKKAVVRALSDPECTIARVQQALLQGRLPVGVFRHFTIHDPKRRQISAAPFLDRVAHHAIANAIEPALDAALLDTVFACRNGKGVHAAIHFAQQQNRCYSWVMHMDIAGYFETIDHDVLRQRLYKRFYGDGNGLLDEVIKSYAAIDGKGLPIGALTSQLFANHYLCHADRWWLRQRGVHRHCRYMDDFLVWGDNRQQLQEVYKAFVDYCSSQLKLQLKPAIIQPTHKVLLYCGARIGLAEIKPSKRRLARFKQRQQSLEYQYANGQLPAVSLQMAVANNLASLLPAKPETAYPKYQQQWGYCDA